MTENEPNPHARDRTPNHDRNWNENRREGILGYIGRDDYSQGSTYGDNHFSDLDRDDAAKTTSFRGRYGQDHGEEGGHQTAGHGSKNEGYGDNSDSGRLEGNDSLSQGYEQDRDGYGWGKRKLVRVGLGSAGDMDARLDSQPSRMTAHNSIYDEPCDNCQQWDHEGIKECIGPLDPEGFIMGCPECNTTKHTMWVCPELAKLKPGDRRRSICHYLKLRHCRPMLAGSLDPRAWEPKDKFDGIRPVTRETALRRELDEPQYWRNHQYKVHRLGEKMWEDPVWGNPAAITWNLGDPRGLRGNMARQRSKSPDSHRGRKPHQHGGGRKRGRSPSLDRSRAHIPREHPRNDVGSGYGGKDKRRRSRSPRRSSGFSYNATVRRNTEWEESMGLGPRRTERPPFGNENKKGFGISPYAPAAGYTAAPGLRSRDHNGTRDRASGREIAEFQRGVEDRVVVKQEGDDTSSPFDEPRR